MLSECNYMLRRTRLVVLSGPSSNKMCCLFSGSARLPSSPVVWSFSCLSVHLSYLGMWGKLSVFVVSSHVEGVGCGFFCVDGEYQRILNVVGHEYFHNWTGNRVTCR